MPASKFQSQARLGKSASCFSFPFLAPPLDSTCWLQRPSSLNHNTPSQGLGAFHSNECTLLIHLLIQYCCQFQLVTVHVLSFGHYLLLADISLICSQQNVRLKTRRIMKTEFSKPIHFGTNSCLGLQPNQSLFKFPLAPMGVLAPRSAHAWPSAQPPINISRNFSEHMHGGW